MHRQFFTNTKVKYWIALAFVLKLGSIYLYISGWSSDDTYGNSSNISIEVESSANNIILETLIDQPNCKIITMVSNHTRTSTKTLHRNRNRYVPSYVDLVPLDDGSHILYRKLRKEDQHCATCCYNELKIDVHFNKIDVKHYQKSCTPFNKVVKIRHAESNMVQTICKSTCVTEVSSKNITQLHPILQVKKNVKAITKVNFWNQKMESSKHKKFQITSKVILITIDGISRSNEQRLIPKTLKILNSYGFHNFKGFTSISQDPKLNFLNSVTGLNNENWDEGCGYSENSNYFECPFIWKEFSKANYVTALMDYSSQINFPKKPTDYYFNLDYYKLMNLTEAQSKSTIHVSDLLFKSSALFNRIFQHSPSISITRLPLSVPSESLDFDSLLSSYVTEISSSPLTNLAKLILIYSNVPAISTTRKISYNVQQPILYVKLFNPNEQKKVNPNLNYFQSSLDRNMLTLTSSFNIYDTLKQILQLAIMNETNYHNNSKLSILKPISKFQNCHNIGVPIGLCPCSLVPNMENLIPFLSSAHMDKLKIILIESLNNGISNLTFCSKFTFQKLIKFTMIVNPKPQLYNRSQEFNVIFEARGMKSVSSMKLQQRVKTTLSNQIKNKVYFQLLGNPVIISKSNQKQNLNGNCLKFSSYPNIPHYKKEFCICKQVLK